MTGFWLTGWALCVSAALSVEFGGIEGQVVGADGKPMPEVVVYAKRTDGASILAAVTDGNGAFELPSLLEGRYFLSASRAGYLSSSYGAAFPGASGLPVHLGPGASVRGIRLVLHRGASMSGIVHALDGTPLAWYQVDILRITRAGQAESVMKLMTDDRGEFRAYALPAGRFAVCARRLRMPFDIDPVTLSDRLVDDLLAELAKGNQPSFEQLRISRGVESRHEGVACSGFTPGTEIELRAGQTRDGVGLLVLPHRTARLSGVAHGASSVVMMPMVGTSGTAAQEVRVEVDGKFTISGVVPGDYRLIAATVTPSPAAGLTTVMVSGEDLDNIAIPVQPLPSLSGRIEVVTGTAIDLSRLSVQLAGNPEVAPTASLPRSSVGGLLVSPVAQVQSDGFFTLRGVPPGPNQVHVRGLPVGWRVKEVSLGGRVLDAATFDLENNTVPLGCRILLEEVTTGLAGELTVPPHLRAEDHIVLVFPQNAAAWGTLEVFKTAVPDLEGRFEFAGLPAGAYWVVAVSPMSVEELRGRPDVLHALSGHAVSVALVDGAISFVSLKIGE